MSSYAANGTDPRWRKVFQTILLKTSAQWDLAISLGSSKTRRYGKAHEVTLGGTPTNVEWMSVEQRGKDYAVINLCTPKPPMSRTPGDKVVH